MANLRAQNHGSKRGLRTSRIDISLRTPHLHYLEYLAEQAGTSISGAFGVIVERHAAAALLTYKPPRKEKKELSIDPRHAAILDKLAVKSGLFKADIARRLIDQAIAQDEMVGG